MITQYDDIVQTEIEMTIWWKWGKPPEHRIKSLWIIINVLKSWKSKHARLNVN